MSNAPKTTDAADATQPAPFPPEQKGRVYNLTRFAVHSRRIGGDGVWYGASHYKSEPEARLAIQSVSKPIMGGLVSFAPGTEPFEYRIVRVESVCTVIHTENRKV